MDAGGDDGRLDDMGRVCARGDRIEVAGSAFGLIRSEHCVAVGGVALI